MSSKPSRRSVLSGLAALAATGPAFAEAPLASLRPLARGTVPEPPPPPEPAPAIDLVRKAGLGGAVGYLVVNARTGEVVEELNPDLRLPPASVAKAATAYYALSRLGAAHRFETRLLATGPVEGGRLKGDLVLQGGGDPILDSDALGEMAAALKAQGIFEVTGRFRVDPSALPYVPEIDAEQPEQVGYNPAIDGLNLNFNRVHFKWKRAGGRYEVSMQARARRYSPETAVAKMTVEDRPGPVFTYEDNGNIDYWTVARQHLGNEGARWLPVSRPADYTADVFQTLARSHGIVLDRGKDVHGATGTPLLTHVSPQLHEMLGGMLRYSTNLTAEAIGLTATHASGTRPSSLIRSAREMNLWYNRALGCHSTGFVDHSGLGYGSRVSARDMVTLLQAARRGALLPKLMKSFNAGDDAIAVKAKTGTLNFVSALAGYIDAPGKPPLTFAIFTADMPRRDAIRIEERERPPGARGWANRSRGLQKQLIRRWAERAHA
ncbi:D-alanyl-D-alanine carboxypeptidase/D-alanyl-D-alanine endopeptidase [Ovoidimarina sediminis]|uniref:D-alanyl-D-alanine carboxypeptidase/D-alanyl-D-alanine endopeptidase n=1 Tax=Ovoidimarina sediminis TaxID=3079856 RepID=UPI00290A296B|nr:D-alanyl-D-alanine carboxypeptidase/D-alanyl-D-alanine-endopeptidase [Rhodophyticola sp. MJ-SS7]MDU8942716.1 D-alanyl-D-alanine carboxypeptidase/D-alanyl-D-alanine-endopeptidase [Rhodophyticola sp. MJ-SS7]